MRKEIFLVLIFCLLAVSSCANRGYNYYTQKALEEQDVSFCDEIEYAILKGDCYVQTAIETSDLSICKRIKAVNKTEEELMINVCYLKFGINKSDVNACDNITLPGGLMVKCYAHFAKQLGDLSICDKLENGSHREICYDQGDIA